MKIQWAMTNITCKLLVYCTMLVKIRKKLIKTYIGKTTVFILSFLN